MGKSPGGYLKHGAVQGGAPKRPGIWREWIRSVCESGKGEEGVTQGCNAGVMHDMRPQRESGVFLSIGDFS